MKNLLLSLFAAILLASCATQKTITYFQDLEPGGTVAITPVQEIRLKPGDQFTVHVNSKDKELVAPFNLSIENINAGGGQTLLAYTVDNEGYIDFPMLGKLHVEGMTRDDLSKHIKKQLLDGKHVGDPVVIVEFKNQQFSVIGEVKSPGKFDIKKDRITILDAISMAGDLTIQGKRENITVLREEYGVQRAYTLNMNDAAQLHMSPAYYLQQNDIVYVEPNKTKAGQSTVNGNTVRSTSFWMSLASFILTIVTLVTR
ncbi:MAG: polysaccharide biosynthesis/export family protein [Bacteroidaceae bacterium]|nr:polysaccharide biosynthesis/export family protein [Bacteroidaceae bacterium]